MKAPVTKTAMKETFLPLEKAFFSFPPSLVLGLLEIWNEHEIESFRIGSGSTLSSY